MFPAAMRFPAAQETRYSGMGELKEVYAPAYKHCETNDGSLAISDRKSFSKAGPGLPIRFQCKENDKLLWELRVHYLEKNMADDRSGRAVSLISQT
ncbi:hypothetical protein Q8A64_04510 [Oxalobacteraceae bacterium R-40]|uniref:Uncharacterized protein n=1 Tax=Keguizhuia sedimenti TaxID=3064264 RepID=A0ABU1BNI7_9BURK|nr:hypothetical protein [Oxalobacteraceae bacterium R-40]